MVYVLIRDEGYDGAWNVWAGCDREEALAAYDRFCKALDEKWGYESFRLEAWDGDKCEVIKDCT